MASVPFCMLRKTRHVPHHFFMFSCNLHWPMEYSVFTCQCTMQNYPRVLSHWVSSNSYDQVTETPLPIILIACGNQTSVPESCGSRLIVTPGLLASMASFMDENMFLHPRDEILPCSRSNIIDIDISEHCGAIKSSSSRNHYFSRPPNGPESI